MKIKYDTLSMLSKVVKDAIKKKDIALYAQNEDFSKANLNAKYVLEIGDTIYTLAGNGSIILSMPKTSDINYEKSDIVELED